MIKESYALFQRQICLMVQSLLQVSLTDEDETDQVGIIQLEIGQQPYLFEGVFARYELGLINDDDNGDAGFIVLIDLLVNSVEQVRLEIRRDR